jgi:hypothetical protein
MRAAESHEVRVTLTQRPRGGIVIEATAERRRGDESPGSRSTTSTATATTTEANGDRAAGGPEDPLGPDVGMAT